jgi:hypothetical protein
MNPHETNSIEPIMRALLLAVAQMIQDAQRTAGENPLRIEIHAGNGMVGLSAEPWTEHAPKSATPQHPADLAGVEVPDSLPEEL